MMRLVILYLVVSVFFVTCGPAGCKKKDKGDKNKQVKDKDSAPAKAKDKKSKDEPKGKEKDDKKKDDGTKGKDLNDPKNDKNNKSKDGESKDPKKEDNNGSTTKSTKDGNKPATDGFTLHIPKNVLTIGQGENKDLKLSMKRGDYQGEVKLTFKTDPPDLENVTIKPESATFAEGESTTKIMIQIGKDAIPGPVGVIITASPKPANMQVARLRLKIGSKE